MFPIQYISFCDLSAEAWGKCWDRLKDTNALSTVKRISIGSYFCEMQFLGLDEERLSRLAAWAEQRAATFSLVIPCPRESLYGRVCRKAEALLAYLPACDEVVLNDEAMAKLALFSGKRLVAGRTMCKYEHDSRLDNSAERVKALLRSFDILMEGPWSCVEADSFDASLICREAPPETLSRLRFHMPAVMLSSTRHCQFAVQDLGARGLLFPYAGCRQQCGKTWAAYRNRLLKYGRGIYQLLPPENTPPRNAICVCWPIIETMEAME